MFRKIVFALCFILISNIAFAEKNPIVATVNGAKITLNELNANYQNAKLYVTDKVVTKKEVLQELINRHLGLYKAKAESLHTDPVVKSKMEDVLYHAQLSKDLENEFTKINS